MVSLDSNNHPVKCNICFVKSNDQRRIKRILVNFKIIICKIYIVQRTVVISPKTEFVHKYGRTNLLTNHEWPWNQYVCVTPLPPHEKEYKYYCIEFFWSTNLSRVRIPIWKKIGQKVVICRALHDFPWWLSEQINVHHAVLGRRAKAAEGQWGERISLNTSTKRPATTI